MCCWREVGRPITYGENEKLQVSQFGNLCLAADSIAFATLTGCVRYIFPVSNSSAHLRSSQARSIGRHLGAKEGLAVGDARHFLRPWSHPPTRWTFRFLFACPAPRRTPGTPAQLSSLRS